MPQFARPEFSVFQCGVSSSIAVTTYLIRRFVCWWSFSMMVTPRFHVACLICRITVGFASGEERTHTFLMFGVPQIIFRGPVIRRPKPSL